MKPLTLSLIILVYNEEHHLKACLDAIAAQTVMPEEVIVVDNNCTDGSMAIARRYKFVKIINQPIQGMIPSRNLGFNAAKGQILARIDADAQLDPDWAERLKTDFQDPTVQAVSGPARTLTIPPSFRPHTRLWPIIYFWWTEAEFGIPILWGANMAIRSSAWKKIRDQACLDDAMVHEDQDLSYLLAGKGLRVVRDNRLIMNTNGQTYHEWAKFVEYVQRRWRTRHMHTAKGTLQTPQTIRLHWWQRLARYVAVIVIGMPFLISSFVLGAFKAVIDVIPVGAPTKH